MSTINASELVTLKMLRYFHRVAEVKNFTAAAEQLHLSKSPLSAQIKELESLLGVELFTRSTRQVELTPYGQLLREKCEQIFELVNISLEQVAQLGRLDRNHIRIGIMSSLFWMGFGDILKSFRKQCPDNELIFQELSPETQKVALAHQEIDFGLVRYADTLNLPHLLAETITSEPMVLALASKHPLARRKSIDLSELKDEPFTLLSRANSASSDLIIASCLAAEFMPQLVQEMVEPNSLMAIIAGDNRVSIVPQSYASQPWPRVKFIKLKQTISADICLIYRPEMASLPILDSLRDLLKQQIKTI